MFGGIKYFSYLCVIKINSFEARINKIMLKKINSFEARTDVKPQFDMGDVIFNGKEVLIVTNLTSTQDGAYFLVKNIDGTTGGLKYEYHDTVKEFKLVKKATKKLQMFISNDGDADGDLYYIAMDLKEYPIWFENEFIKLTV